MQTIAAFDFDCTITTRDTLLPFLRYSAPSRRQGFLNLLKLIPTAFQYKTGLLENHAAKEKVLNVFLRDVNYQALLTQAKQFAATEIGQYVKPEALQRLLWHKAQGHRCVLISAGLEIYLRPWAEQLEFHDVLATRLALSTDGARVTGRIEGCNCFGQEKVERLLKLAGPKENFVLYAYGDSRGDKELLALADHAFYRHMPNAEQDKKDA